MKVYGCIWLVSNDIRFGFGVYLKKKKKICRLKCGVIKWEKIFFLCVGSFGIKIFECKEWIFEWNFFLFWFEYIFVKIFEYKNVSIVCVLVWFGIYVFF